MKKNINEKKLKSRKIYCKKKFFYCKKQLQKTREHKKIKFQVDFIVKKYFSIVKKYWKKYWNVVFFRSGYASKKDARLILIPFTRY